MNLDSSSVLYLWRGVAARKAENMGVHIESIKRAGGWANSALQNSYLAPSVALDACRALANFTSISGSYYLCRTAIEPSETLINAVFPVSTIAQSIKEYQEKTNNTEIADTQFFKLLRYFAITLLQDSFILMQDDEYGDHPLFKNSLFQSPLFQQFKAELIGTTGTQVEPHQLLL